MDWRNRNGHCVWLNVCMGVLMNIPYNNGKVQIGKYYQKPRYVEQDADMIAIQGWLIGDNKAAMRNRYANVAYWVLVAVAIVLAVVYA